MFLPRVGSSAFRRALVWWSCPEAIERIEVLSGLSLCGRAAGVGILVVVSPLLVVSPLPTGTVTFLFCDVEGSTRLWEEHREEMGAALARHDELLWEAVRSHHGHIVKMTGDGGYAVFATALEAVGTALNVQRALSEEEWGSTPLRVRMGIHTGEAQLRDGDYFGGVLNRAARLMNAGHGGQTLVSLVTAELVGDSLPVDVGLRDLGEHRLRDLSRPERVFQLDGAGLGVEFPLLRSLNAFPGQFASAGDVVRGAGHGAGPCSRRARSSPLGHPDRCGWGRQNPAGVGGRRDGGA